MIRFLLAAFKPFRWLIERMGADYDQFIRILHLKLTLDDRRASNFGRQKGKELSNSILKQSFLQIFIGAMFTAILFMVKSPFTYFFFVHIFLMVMMAMLIISEFTTILFDTSENVIIQPLPIKGNTVNLARNAHVFVYLISMALSLSILSIVLSFFKFGVITSLLFLVTIFMNVLFTLFFANILYLGIMRLASGEKLKNLLMYFQVFIAIFFMAAYQFGMKMIDRTEILNMVVPIKWYSFLTPPAFFAGFLDAINTSNYDFNHCIFIIEAAFIPVIALWVTGKYLTPVFNRKLLDLDQGDRTNKVKVQKQKSGKTSFWFRLMSPVFIHREEERPAFRLMWKLTGRERMFKQTILPSFGYLIIMLIVPLLNHKGSLSDLKDGNMHLLVLYCFAISAATIGTALLIGQNKHAEWIFKTLPIQSPADFFKGAFKAAFARFFVPFYIPAVIFVCAFWGIRALPDALVAFLLIYLFSLLSYYLQNPHFPFTMEKSAIQGGANVMRMFLLMGLGALAGFGHNFLLGQTPFADAILAPLYLVLIWLVNRKTIHNYITWRKVDKVNSYI